MPDFIDIVSGRAAKKSIRAALKDVAETRRVAELRLRVEQEALVAQLVETRRDDSRRLTSFGGQVFSQGEEDGILSEIFRRVGVTNRMFAECGVGDGLENNTAYPLLRGWSGYWFEADSGLREEIARTFRRPLSEGRLTVAAEFLTKESVAGAFARHGVPTEFDLLSLDIDRNTSHLWRGLKAFRPRVVVAEYNASIPASDAWEIEYDPNATWNGSVYFGASLKAFELLGREMGYSLVGCTLTGVNAFFVRDDLISGQFAEPFTAEYHYEPPRYYLIRGSGHPRHFPV